MNPALPRGECFLAPRATTLRILAGLGLWAAALAWGFHAALSHAGAPGERVRSVPGWPADAPVPLDPLRPTLVLAAHPRCPCTRATLEELDRLAARCAGRASIQVLFYSDPALGEAWERTGLWERAASIPGVRVSSDPLGRTAALFAARTSGQVFLFAPDGTLLFEGGITPARGHEGASPGSQAIADLLLDGSSAVASTPVFGCPLAPCDP